MLTKSGWSPTAHCKAHRGDRPPMGTGVVARHWGVSTGVGAHQASRDLRQMAAAAMVGGTVSASTRRASKTSAPPSSHSVKTTGRAVLPLLLLLLWPYIPQTLSCCPLKVIRQASGECTDVGEIDRKTGNSRAHASQLRKTGGPDLQIAPKAVATCGWPTAHPKLLHERWTMVVLELVSNIKPI